ncbi:eukaryotic translation initiation factor 3 subunit G-like [Sycon ciliatum]|uniref:eukaryotic translation initiation factor 3 subunit G-like n=1 Tax=Sycon ciliatum TaxID=27933 RepID=UPI0020AEA5EE|eukprot:scpid73698/ scgid13200/ Eukaryotic translation initiation factor 3 subunit G; Eukaryotic translation initiation factor 3 RNA-binding subunit; Eukaryotic translation initiation factor 3 subunit 4
MPSHEAASWADQVEAGEEGALPPSSEKIENNVKTVTTYKRNDDGKVVRVTRTYKIEKRRVPKAIAQRKHWKKFGQSAHDGPGPNATTTTVADDVFLTLTTNREQLETQDDDSSKSKGLKQAVTCRICKGEHWTTKCPYKETLGEAPVNKDAEAQPGDATPAAAAAASLPGQKYVPPSQRGDRSATGASMGRGRDDNGAGVRVSNLSEETTEQDLQELFKPFGRISRIYLAKDKITGQSKGFAFVTYYDRDDAARAIRGLQGFGYDHLILNLEWAK